MKVLFFATECKPFSKVGGVGDVALELPIALQKEGIDIEIVTPLYSSINRSWVEETPYHSYSITFNDINGKKKEESVVLYRSTFKDIKVTFVQNSTYFEGEYGMPYVFSPTTPFYDDFIRFHFFSVASIKIIEEKTPDIVHANDWGLGFLMAKLKMDNNPSKRVFSIHNNAYQGNMWIPAIKDWSVMEFFDRKEIKKSFIDPRKKWESVNPLKLGILSSDAVNTVSPSYKKEMLLKDKPSGYFSGAAGLEKSLRKINRKGRMYGIINGFEYKPDRDFETTIKEKDLCKKELSLLFENPDNFLLGFVGRAVEQKFKLLQEDYKGKSILEHIVEIKNINIAILATGLPEYEEFLEKFKGLKNVSVTLAFDKVMAGRISLGCDLFLMPSLFEPCGITQMESLSNATPPLVRYIGGLKDTVISYKKSGGTGFGFTGYSKKSILKNLLKSVSDSVDVYYNEPVRFQDIREEAFKQRFLWSDSAKEYIGMYKDIIQGDND